MTILDLNADAGRAVATEIGARFACVDVADEGQVAEAMDAAEAANGVARVLVNCAGIVRTMKTVSDDGAPHAADVFRKLLEVNLVGAFVPMAQFAARVVAAGGAEPECGVIINTASAAAYDGQASQAAYSASKAGVAGLTLPVARDLAPHRIRVVSIAPGYFLTGMTDQLPAEIRQRLGGEVPHPKRLGDPDEFAQLVQSVIANPMLNGEVIRLDGGLRLSAS